MRTVILCPRRSDGGQRDRLWEFCRARIEAQHPDWDLYEGHHNDGLFNRSAVINAAAIEAGTWDVAFIIDADVIWSVEAAESAVDVADRTGRIVIAHDQRIMLSRRGTELVLDGFTGNWRGPRMADRSYYDSVSSAVAVSRWLWDLVGGFDEQFGSWGREDSCFLISCEVESGDALKVLGETYHLWHELSPDGDPSTPGRQQVEARHAAYVEARWDRDAVRALRQQTTPVIERIPRRIIRSVPTVTTDETEQWWADTQAMNPGFEFVTYRDPIDPTEFPLTADLWDQCESGAQLAGLIRLEALYHHGGIYLDADCLPVRPLDELLAHHAFAGWEDDTCIPDAVLGCVPGHPAWELMLRQARTAIQKRRGAWKSGPGVTTRVLSRAADVFLYPPDAFYAVHYLEKARFPEVNANPPAAAFVIHQYRHSWGSPEDKARIAAQQKL